MGELNEKKWNCALPLSSNFNFRKSAPCITRAGKKGEWEKKRRGATFEMERLYTRRREAKGRNGGQPGSSVRAASCENRLMMQLAAELHRVLLGTSTRHMLHCCEAPRSSFLPLLLPLPLCAATRRAPFKAREINVRLVARRFSGSSATNHRRTDAAAAALGGKKRTRRAAGALRRNGWERERGSYCENVPHCYRTSSSSRSLELLPAFRPPRRRLVLGAPRPYFLALALRPARRSVRLHPKTRRCNINRREMAPLLYGEIN